MTYNFRQNRGFTLIETMVAITLISIAIVAPITLSLKSLESAHYARDQVAASFLAHEAIEDVRAIRDGNILNNNETGQSKVDVFNNIPISTLFLIDTALSKTWTNCTNRPLKVTSLGYYGYSNPDPCSSPPGWTASIFFRTVIADPVVTVAGVVEELRVTSTVTWTSTFGQKSTSVTENIYRWNE